jgi:ABC-type transport system substrate-binding protein
VEVLRKTNPNAVVQAFHNSLAPFGVALAQDRPPFNDVRVRRAMCMAIDRQKMVDTVFEGHGIIGWGVPYIYYQDTQPTGKDFGPWWQYKPAEAKKLLTEAGHGKGFETTLFYYEYFPQMTSEVQLVQQDLKRTSTSTSRSPSSTTRPTTAATSRTSGTACRGGSSRATPSGSTSAPTSTCTRARRRTSSGSTTRSSTT